MKEKKEKKQRNNGFPLLILQNMIEYVSGGENEGQED